MRLLPPRSTGAAGSWRVRQNPAMPEDGELGIARAHATKVVPLARSDQSVGEVLATLPGRRFESADDIVVLEGSSLKGLVPIATLLAASPQARIAGVMNADPPVVAPGADQEAVAWEMVRRGESSVAVVDAAGNFEGLVPPQRMVAVVLAEHDEDVARLAGYLASTRRARQAAEETVARRLWHRLPWLLVGLAGAVASAAIIGAFEEELNDNVLLAFFHPRGRVHGGSDRHPDASRAHPGLLGRRLTERERRRRRRGSALREQRRLDSDRDCHPMVSGSALGVIRRSAPDLSPRFYRTS